MQNNTEILLRISQLEDKVKDLERTELKLQSVGCEVINNKIEKLKDDIHNNKDITNIEDSLKILEKDISSIKDELPEMRLVKKLVLGLIVTILTLFIGLVWNVTIKSASTISGNSSTDLNEIAKKFAEEYKKQGEKR